jgi:hypothetical protein
VNLREKLFTVALRVAELLHLPRLLFTVLSLVPSHPLTDYFHGIEQIEAVQQIFGDKTEEVLSNLKVQFIRLAGYMGVNPSNGNLIINPNYLNNGDELDIYLDLIHELVHVRQRMEGKTLFDNNYRYVERPTEIEAYRYAVEEAKRLGLSSEKICRYLKTEWMSENDLRQLAKNFGVECQ